MAGTHASVTGMHRHPELCFSRFGDGDADLWVWFELRIGMQHAPSPQTATPQQPQPQQQQQRGLPHELSRAQERDLIVTESVGELVQQFSGSALILRGCSGFWAATCTSGAARTLPRVARLL
jgi:hypothetical protein